jgi:hypothetical protein
MLISRKEITVSREDMLSEVTNIRVVFITQEQWCTAWLFFADICAQPCTRKDLNICGPFALLSGVS